jgi:peptidoglycan/xylan/chitin deacetylase (PgdA/CDA1 family)
LEAGAGALKLSPFLRSSVALHAAAIPALAVAPGRWPWIIGTLLANHYVTIAGGLLPRSALLGPNLVRSAAAQSSGAVALTFDDGPEADVTPQVLDVLDAWDVKASFFCIGEKAERNRVLTAEIAQRGHRLENHTYSHRSAFFFHRPSVLDREIGRCQDELARASGRAPAFFRAPAGIRSPFLEGALERAGLRLASWTRRGFDTVSRDPERVSARLTRGLRAGDVLLLHDGAGAAEPEGKPAVLGALPRVLEAIAAAGLRATPLQDDLPVTLRA